MKKQVTLLLAAALLPLTLWAARPVTFWGCLVNAGSWWTYDEADYPIAMYSFEKTDGTPTLTQISPVNKQLYGNGGAFIKDGIYHSINYTDGKTTYTSFNTSDWTAITTKQLAGFNDTYSPSLAYDPTTGKAYGIVHQLNSAGQYQGSYLCTFDEATQLKSTICKVDDSFMSLHDMACDNNGQLYAIDGNANLIKIDKTNGEATVVGPTGVNIEGYAQAMAFDPQTNDLYWAADDGKMYSIDTTTGAATALFTFPDGESWDFLYVVPAEAADDAPAAVSGLKAVFNGTSLQGTVSFRLPVKTYGGNDLTGSLDYTVSINGTEAATGSAQAGDSVDVAVNGIQGEDTITVTASNAAGKGVKSTVTTYVGNDVPAAPTNIKASVDYTAKTVNLTWDAPSKGLNGGYVDPSAITYKVVSPTDNKTLADNISATSAQVSFESQPLDLTAYSVVAKLGTAEGGKALSDSVLVGDPLSLPYTQPFGDAKSLRLFTIVDANNDGSTWAYNDYFGKPIYNESKQNAADDWLITPPFTMQGGHSYSLKFNCRGTFVTYPEKIEVALLKNTDINNEVQTIVEPTEIYTVEDTASLAGLISVAEDGAYSVGFHAISDADHLNIILGNIHIEPEALPTAPAAADTISVEAGEKGALTAQVHFKAPSLAVNGEAITSLDSALIYRNDSIIGTLKPIVPGEEYTYNDNVPEDGKYTYTVVCYNASGLGAKATATAFIGTDIAGAPSDVRLSVVDGKAVLTWTEPNIGINGGYINQQALRYNLYEVVNSSYGSYHDFPAKLTSISGPQFTFTDIDPLTGEQSIAQYALTTVQGNGESDYADGNKIVVGAPYSLDYLTETATAPYFAKVTTNGAKDVTLSFGFTPESSYYGSTPKLIVEVDADPQGKPVAIDTIDFSTLEAGTPQQVTYDLQKYVSGDYLVVYLRTAEMAYPSVTLDSVRIFDNVSTGISSISSDTTTGVSEIYSIDGKRLASPSRGLNIIRTRDGRVRKVVIK